MKKKIPPKRRPATMADVKRAKDKAVSEATHFALVLFLTVMRDKEGFGAKRLNRVWREIEKLSEAVAQGYVKIPDMQKVLYEEAGILW